MMIDTLGINRRFYGNRIGNGLEFFRNRLKNPIPDTLTLIQSELSSDPTLRTGLFHTLDLNDLYTTSAGEVNVVADGDPVGLITNQIGTITTTSPVSAERPIYKVTPEGVSYLQFLGTSRVTFNFGAAFVGAMVVSTLEGSYIVEIDSATTFVWGQYMPVRDVTGISFIEGFDIQTSKGAQFRELLNTDTDGQLGFTLNRGLLNAFTSSRISAIRPDLFHNLAAPSLWYAIQINKIKSLPANMFEGSNRVTTFEGFARFTPELVDIPPNLFDSQEVCTNYTQLAAGSTLTPQSVENILVSINLSATNNNLLNGTLGIRGDNNPLTTNAEIARQALLAKGWTLTLDNIQPYEYALFKMEI